MSAQSTVIRPNTVPKLRARKGAEPIVCLTAYTAPMAQLLDPHADLLLVGDSLGMVLYGLPSTVPVTLDMMIAHGAAVARGATRALVVVDMPFGTYEESPQQAYRNAVRVLRESGASAVKLEGGAVMAETIAFLTSRGIPVMGHVGLLPQSVNASGGYAALGTADTSGWDRIIADAVAVAEAGAFLIVVEAVSEPLAVRITESIAVPTIGIGASASCDGQVLVIDDMLGMSSRTPKFVKRYAELGVAIGEAAGRYAEEVRSRQFPSEQYTYRLKGDNRPSDGDRKP
ncbi:3-methyl-2-oxobutanoate hydroxymethyltransferase [Zavarzinia compransoris]|uniref:3-methyl-2-oxobutanoate hydroxymethyltransferase n=1 Tax=Zavarzinia compransoris TaxID=1264899 RepID=A0A317E073_9PROT|nr:3-methyl-2-oxobutanoate hydroxymethyltransferase [Zavarzinia compransoris]PWR20042.1 3-methyl-2-oxobutanoate hydroxymethyltransferase [Zavarzinia compransoris]TDP44837.1 ketopantoate hydroxymethyltransferase [Zavarzinia compransoris]